MLMMLETPRRSTTERALTLLTRSAHAAMSVVDAVVLWPFRVSENRRVLDSLGAMDDHELRDIGLNRQDLRDATALWANQDVTSLFSARRRDRRVWH